MNDVINSQGYTQAAYWNRIPTAAWYFMAAIALCSNFLFGYRSRNHNTAGKLILVLPLIVSIAFLLIADIDAPRHGLIEVRPQNLESLAKSLMRRSQSRERQVPLCYQLPPANLARVISPSVT
jgi:hypothetical protein